MTPIWVIPIVSSLWLFVGFCIGYVICHRQFTSLDEKLGDNATRINTLEKLLQQPELVTAPSGEEPIHVMLSPYEMACGATEGAWMLEFGAERVTCEGCKEWLSQNR